MKSYADSYPWLTAVVLIAALLVGGCNFRNRPAGDTDSTTAMQLDSSSNDEAVDELLDDETMAEDVGDADTVEENVVDVPQDTADVPITTPSPLQVYFTNSKRTRSNDCEKVYGVARTNPESMAVAEEAVSELLRGPTRAEQKQGYSTEIPAGTRLLKVRIEKGVATANFSRELELGGGACHNGAIRAQIENTLMQFPTVKSVVISIEGRGMDVLEP